MVPPEDPVEPLGTGVAAALPDGAAAAAEGDAEALGGTEAGELSDGDGAPDARMVCLNLRVLPPDAVSTCESEHCTRIFCLAKSLSFSHMSILSSSSASSSSSS